MSTRKPFAREGSRRCHKVRDAIGVAQVRLAILTQGKWFDHTSSPFCAYRLLFVFASRVCLRDRGRPRLANRSLSAFHTSLTLPFSR